MVFPERALFHLRARYAVNTLQEGTLPSPTGTTPTQNGP